MLAELCSRLVIYNDCLWICGSVYEYIIIVGGIAIVFSSIYILTVKLCACLVSYSDYQWNFVRVQQFIVIFRGIILDVY